MAKDTLLPLGLISKGEARRGGNYSLEKFLRDTFTRRLNVPFYDACCPLVGTQLPVGVNRETGRLNVFDTTTKAFIPIDAAALGATNGAVTQLTNETTAVVSNTDEGVITTVALTTAADASFNFTLTNSKILTTSVISLTGLNAGAGVVNVNLVSIAAGSAVLKVTNVGTAAFNSLIKIHFKIS